MMEQMGPYTVDDVIGLDFGASRVAAVLAEMTQAHRSTHGRVQVQNGHLRSVDWLQGAGTSVHRASLHEGLGRVLEGLRVVAGGRSLRRAWAGLPSAGIETRPLRARVPLRSGIVTERDCSSLLKDLRHAAANGAGSGRFLLHMLPTRWKLDESATVNRPVAKRGQFLELRSLAIYAPMVIRDEVIASLSAKNLFCEGVVLGSLAAGHALLSPDQRRRGVALVDIGSDTTDVSIWACGRPIHFATVPEGGRNITRQLAADLRITLEEAERLKCDCMQSATAEDLRVGQRAAAMRGSHGASRQLAAMLSMGFHLDLLRRAKALLDRSGLQVWENGVVLCGGGMSASALLDQARGIFADVPVMQQQTTLDESIRNDLRTHRLAAAIGLLELARQPSGGDLLLDPREASSFGWFRSRVRAFVDEYF